ncbi:hypothetical protein VDGD_02579 [Verticillium dahliae]|nr:hypothetical protein VDGD_02579 [Verticillium dahliae]
MGSTGEGDLQRREAEQTNSAQSAVTPVAHWPVVTQSDASHGNFQWMDALSEQWSGGTACAALAGKLPIRPPPPPTLTHPGLPGHLKVTHLKGGSHPRAAQGRLKGGSGTANAVARD